MSPTKEMWFVRLLPAVASVLALCACGAETTSAPEETAPAETPRVETPAPPERLPAIALVPDHMVVPIPEPRAEPHAEPREPDPVPVAGGLGEGTPAELLPAEPEVAPPTRARRRMDIDQLEASILRVTGGIGWTEGNKNQFEELARTLGKPNFVDLTSEDLEPSALFQKFLDDAARSVCGELVEADLAAPAAERQLMKHAGPDVTWKGAPNAVIENLRYLLLRYHGRSVASDAPELEPWRWLYEAAEHVAKDPSTGWRTVCVGLIVHPRFYTY